MFVSLSHALSWLYFPMEQQIGKLRLQSFFRRIYWESCLVLCLMNASYSLQTVLLCELTFLTISVKKYYLLDGSSPTIIRSKKIAHKKPNVLLPTWNKVSPWRSTRGSKVTVSRYPVLHKSKFSGDTTKVGHTDCD